MLAVSPGIMREIRATLAIAAPLAGANLAQMAMGFTDTVMVGHLGGVALAAAGLGGLLYFTSVFVLQGVVSAVSPLCAHALGAGDWRTVGRIAGKGLVLAALLSIPLAAVAANLHRALLVAGYDPPLAEEIGRFLRAVAGGAPALLCFAVLRSLLAALSRTRAVMRVLVACVPANLVLNWILIYGHLGVPPLGVAGAGLASAIVAWLMFIVLVVHVVSSPGLASLRLLQGALARHWRDLDDILRLGVPIGGHLAIEVGAFVATGVIMGLIGTQAAGANQIVLNVATITFMVPLGLAHAATVRCGLELGGERPHAARRAGLVALAIGAAFMAMAAMVMLAVPTRILAVYIDLADPENEGIVAIARRLILIAALFQVFDGVQTIAAGALRGYKDTLGPMLLAGIGYWVVGFAAGAILAFPLGHGAAGLWWGLALGTAVVAVLLTARFARLSLPDGRLALSHGAEAA
jgi:MATE family multidrug resistance protein